MFSMQENTSSRKRKLTLSDDDAPEDQIRLYKRIIVQISTQYVKDAGNEFMWFLLPLGIVYHIMSFITRKTRRSNTFITDISQLINIGLTCKTWWRGPPERAWFRKASNTYSMNSPFSMLSYLRKRFIPRVPLPITCHLTTKRIVNFEGLEKGKWAYVKDDPKRGSYYVPLDGHPALIFRPLVNNIGVYGNVENFPAKRISSSPNHIKEGQIGYRFLVRTGFSFEVFRKQKVTEPQVIVFCFNTPQFSYTGEQRLYQTFRMRIFIQSKATHHNIRKAIAAGTPTKYKLVE